MYNFDGDRLMNDEARRIVEGEVSRRLSDFENLPDDLRDLVERHCSALINLTEAMRQAGKDPADIRSMVSVLLSTYEADLVRVIEDRK